MNLRNFTKLNAGLTVSTDKHGHEFLVVVAKGTYQVLENGTCTLADQQWPIIYADEPYGEGSGSIRYETDFAPFKPFTDVVVNGFAYSRPESRMSTNVSLRIGSIHKRAQVFGDRYWMRAGLMDYVISDPQPFSRMPLVWERAFGGVALEEGVQVVEPRNLIGVGIHGGSTESILGSPLPNIESSESRIVRPTDRPPPVGFGFVPRTALERRRHAGTYDDNWRAKQFPLLPLDFDERYYQGAPADQQCSCISGGEKIELMNLTPDGYFSLSIPMETLPIRVIYAPGLGFNELYPVLDTILVEPSERRCTLTWRARLQLKIKMTDVRVVCLGIPSRAWELAMATGKRYQPRKHAMNGAVL